MDECDAVRVRSEPLPRDPQSVLVAVEADEMDAGESLEERFGVAAHAEGGIDEHGTLLVQGGCEQFDAAVEEYRGVDVAQAHDVRGILLPRS